MATKAPTIISVDRDKMLVQVLNEDGSYASVHVKDMDKNTLIKLGTFLNVTWAGTPMHKTLDTIQRIVNAKLLGVSVPAVPTKAPVVPAVKPSALPVGSSLDAVIATMLQTLCRLSLSGLTRMR